MKASNQSQTANPATQDQTALGSAHSPAARARTNALNEGGEPTVGCSARGNTEHLNSKTVVTFKALRWGVDSLYLSFKGELYPEKIKLLDKLKRLAQAVDASEVAQAQIAIGEHIFEVKDKGTTIFSYVLADGAFYIKLAKPSKTHPMAYVQIAAEYLAQVGPQEAAKHLATVLSELGAIDGDATVSRIDLFADFQTNCALDDWGREAWVTRAKGIDAHSVNDLFTGWSIGMGGKMSARMYNKTAQIFATGKIWVMPLWQQVGWDITHDVYRMEFQFRREVLAQFKLDTLSKVLFHQGGLWSYATTEWLRLTIPNQTDETRSRWTTHALWGFVSSIDWESSGGPLLKRQKPTRDPSSQKMVQMVSSLILSHAAVSGLDDIYDAYEDMGAHLHEFITAKADAALMPVDLRLKVTH